MNWGRKYILYALQSWGKKRTSFILEHTWKLFFPFLKVNRINTLLATSNNVTKRNTGMEK